uniref:Uncharacterized protein n=1 Tax=Meloidogyne incognita TaxID=6306 RepID=A0A914M710_MELIC
MKLHLFHAKDEREHVGLQKVGQMGQYNKLDSCSAIMGAQQLVGGCDQDLAFEPMPDKVIENVYVTNLNVQGMSFQMHIQQTQEQA